MRFGIFNQYDKVFLNIDLVRCFQGETVPTNEQVDVKNRDSLTPVLDNRPLVPALIENSPQQVLIYILTFQSCFFVFFVVGVGSLFYSGFLIIYENAAEFFFLKLFFFIQAFRK